MQYWGCLYLVAASLTAEYQSSNDATIVWEHVHTRNSIGLLETGLRREDFTHLLIKAGYVEKPIYSDNLEKWCPIWSEDDSILSQNLLQKWEEGFRTNRLSQLAIQPSETVDYITKNHLLQNQRHRGVFSTLSDSNKMNVLTKMARDARATIYQYSTLDDKSRNIHYNPAVIDNDYGNCLRYWQSTNGKVNHRCSLNKLLQGVDIGHISFTGKYSCMHDSTNGMVKLEPKTGIPLRLARHHIMFSTPYVHEIIIAWRGNVYLLKRDSSSDGFWSFITNNEKTKNSLQQSLSFNIVKNHYTTTFYVTKDLPDGSEISIAGDNHPAGDEMEKQMKKC